MAAQSKLIEVDARNRKRSSSAPARVETRHREPWRAALLGALAGFAAVALAACGGGDDSGSSEAQTSPGAPAEQAVGAAEFPEIVAVEATRNADGSFDFAVTMSSRYDTPERYADGWRVLTVDGEVLGEMTLLHDHANEQPFTRTQSAVAVPSDVETVVIEGRDLQNGYGGDPFDVELP